METLVESILFLHIPCQSQPGFLDNVVHRLGSQTILAHRTGDSVKNINVLKKTRETLLVRWLNQPILKNMLPRQIGSFPQF